MPHTTNRDPLAAPQHHVSDRLYCLRELNTMTLNDWQTVPITRVPVSHLTPTQACLNIDRLIQITQGHPRENGDACGHTINYNNRLYIHDGHHDWAIRWLRGERYIPVRIKHITAACTDPCECQD